MPNFIPSIAPLSPSSIVWGWYNWPVVAAVPPSGLSLTPLRIIIRNNYNNNKMKYFVEVKNQYFIFNFNKIIKPFQKMCHLSSDNIRGRSELSISCSVSYNKDVTLNKWSSPISLAENTSFQLTVSVAVKVYVF
jgi:hypothetical protein